MDISNSQANIGAAFEVVRQTIFSLSTFFKELDEVAGKAGYSSLVQGSPGFLRYRSDPDPWGWMVNSFIKVYRKVSTSSPTEEGPVLNSIIYGLEVDCQEITGPIVKIFQFEYEPSAERTDSLAVNLHWQFYWPLHGSEDFILTHPEKEGGQFTSKPKSSAIGSKYRGMIRATWTCQPLSGITNEQVPGLVSGFGSFQGYFEAR